MSDSPIAPTEGRGGAAPTGSEFHEKGDAADVAADGIVPAGLGGADAPGDLQQEATPEMGTEVLGGYATDPDVTATDGGVDLSAGDNADATSNGGAALVEGTPDASAVQTQPDPDDAS
ncbi:MAG TPA: hypothetical protein VIJ51_02680 [Solirubrobacteraceae bacterium]